MENFQFKRKLVSFEGRIQWSELYGLGGTKRKDRKKKKNEPQTLCEVQNQTMWVNKLYGNARAKRHMGQTESHDGPNKEKGE